MKNKTNNYINISEKEDSSTKDFFCPGKVDRSCNNSLKIIFDTLLLQKKVKQQELADFLGVDKAYISRVVHGLQIPPLNTRLKIASFFGVDSCLIWQYPEIKKEPGQAASSGLDNQDKLKGVQNG